MTSNLSPLSIIDSHIHLYAKSHLPRLNWASTLPSSHRLRRQNSVDEYRTATQHHNTLLKGFIFLETDRISGLENHEWEDALEEVSFLLRIARGTPRDGEGHVAEDGRLVLGIVSWAPVPFGPKGLEAYIAQVKQRAGNEWHLIKGFRYLVQDKTAGTMLEPRFIEGLEYLGSRNLTFDLGVDACSGGIHQLEEAYQMMDILYKERNCALKIIINHLCKPNLQLTAQDLLDGHSDFTKWRDCVTRMAGYKHTYMKLSGLFSEVPVQDEDAPSNIQTLIETTKSWVDVVFEAFGPSRIMFGSDWPVCNVGGPGIHKSWDHWHDLVEAILESRNLSEDEKARIWSKTAMEAYDVTLPT